MQIGRKMTEFEAFEVLSVVLEHPVYITLKMEHNTRHKNRHIFIIFL